MAHMTTLDRIAKQLLEKLHENETVSSMNDLSNLLERLENKTDPNQTEIHLAMSINETIEKLNSLENQLKSFVSNSNETLPGNKLYQLYENSSDY